MNKTFAGAKAAFALTATLALAGALAPSWVAAQGPATPPGQGSAQNLNNPLNRNPANRSGGPDTAPVPVDPRNSTSRPTLPAAPGTPDSRDAAQPAPEPARDAAPPAPAAEKPAELQGI